MLSKTFLAAAMATLASAAAIPTAPTPLSSIGITLMMRVVDPDTDFSPPVDNVFLSSAHIGAAMDAVVPATADHPEGRVFWVNGTDEEIQGKQGRLMTDSGSFAQGWAMNKDGNTLVSPVTLLPGLRNPGVTVTNDGLAFLQPEDYMACKRPFPVGGQTAVELFQRDTRDNAQLPDDCIKVKLIPQCADLPPLQDGADYNRDLARFSRCYADAKSVQL